MNVDASAGTAVGESLAGLPLGSLSSLLSGAVPLLPAGTVIPLPVTVLRDLWGPLQTTPVVLAAMPVDALLAVVAPVATSLPAGTLLAVVRAAVSRLPLASVLGILGPLVGSSGAAVPRVGTGAATGPSMTTTTGPATTTTTVPVVAAAPARALTSSPISPRCATAREDVEAAGLVLPAQFEYRCPGSTGLFAGDRQH